MAKLGIIKLLTEVGEEHVRVQFLGNCMTEIKSVKGGSKVSFATDHVTPNEVAFNNPKNVGIIVWVPKDLADKVLAESKQC